MYICRILKEDNEKKYFLNNELSRLWRNEVGVKKRERTRQQAAERKQAQKLLLIKVKF